MAIKQSTGGFLFGLLLVMVLPCAAQDLTDTYINTAVEHRLAQEKGISAQDVEASTYHGIVTLSGTIDNLPARDRAVVIAQSTRSVLGVLDRVIVVPVARADESIRNDVVTALQQDPATGNFPVTVAVRSAVVSLTGTVGSYAEKRLVGRIAATVKGAQEVRNNIAISYLSKRSDQEIAGELNARLQWDVWLAGGMIFATVKNRAVALTGEIPSAVGKSRAFDDAWVNGVNAVDVNGLRVNPAAHYPDQRKFPSGAAVDSEIRAAVLASFRTDPRVMSFAPEVTVSGGIVTLSGAVGNLNAKAAAEEDARDIVGVWRIGNYLKIRSKDDLADAEMEKQLRAALARDPLLEGATIEARVINHVAYLSGEVESGVQRAEAQTVASRVKCVLLIRNRVKIEPSYTVYYYNWPNYDFDENDQSDYNLPPYAIAAQFGPQPYPSDDEIKGRIESALAWCPFVDTNNIQISVSGGVGTLTGTVDTWIGWGEASKDARQNAAYVINQIEVRKHTWQ